MLQTSRRKVVWFLVDLPFRVVALMWGLIALGGFLRFAPKIGFSINLLMLAYVALPFLCVAVPIHPSRSWERALLISMFMAVGYTVIEVADFVRRRELFEGDGLTVDFFLFRAVYFLVAFWFLARMRGLIPRGQRARP